ncbi:MAG: DUF3179 domain-containing protein [Acidimicrobiales bacterium]
MGWVGEGVRRLWVLVPIAALALGVGAVVTLDDDPDPTTPSAAADDVSASEETAPPEESTRPEANAEVETIAVDQIAGDPRDDGPSALDDMRNPAFPEPLVDPDEIRSGGPPPDGIPPIDDPMFQPASTVDWLDDVEPVLLLEIGDEARAYPVQIMTWHEIVNDTFGDVPVTVSYCPLCNSALVYLRTAGDRVLDFGTSGRLFNSSLVMYDRQTESLWSHFTGEAVIGVLTGTTLDTLPVTTVSWSTFRDAHPEGLVLSRDTGFNRNYGTNPYVGYDDVNQSPFLFDGELDGRLPPQTRVVAIRGTSESIAVPLDDLTTAGVITTVIDGEPVMLLHTPGTASALDSATIADGRDIGAVGVYRPLADGVAVDLTANGDGTFTDAATTSTFDILGVGVSGDLSGARLEPVEHLDTFWFAIAAFEPDTRIISE